MEITKEAYENALFTFNPEPGDTPTMPFTDDIYDQREALDAAGKIHATNKPDPVFVKAAMLAESPSVRNMVAQGMSEMAFTNAAIDIKGRGFALLDDMKALGNRVDQRSLAVARTQFETAMLWLEQALKGSAK